ncbi:beta-mannosidase [Dokdonella soli]|uniref:Beta-mannosidase B n=1 Tax=Dokdonella soli TaxID=529810 RepID=A0ABN1IVE6_9GAMM
MTRATFGPACALMLLFGAVANAAAPTTRTLHEHWQFRLLPGDAQAAQHPQMRDWMPASVPGEVHTDLLAASLIPDPDRGSAEAGLQWIGLADWEYRAHFDLGAETLRRRHLDLIFEGLDTYAEVTLNGKGLLSADNMHRRWRVPAKAHLKARGNELRVVLHSPIHRLLPIVQAIPPSQRLPGAYSSAFGDEPPDVHTDNYVRKANYQYGWDWGPRYVTAGIWRPVKLEAWDGFRIDDFHIKQDSVAAGAAQLEAELDVDADAARAVELALDYRGPDGKRSAAFTQQVTLKAGHNVVRMPLRIEQPRRWFPAGYGEQALYTFDARLGDVAVTRRTGLRSIELRREKDGWGRSMAFVVNGIPVFAKGANVIPFDSFASRVTRAQHAQVLRAAREDNMNMLRLWGGGYYESDDLYDLADELGLLLWQDFMFGGAIPPADDPAFRANVRAEAIDQLTRLRDHPSIALWCGNNEIETSWKGWGDRQTFKKGAPERAAQVWAGYRKLFGDELPALAARYHGDVPYWSSSPGTNLQGEVDVDDDGDRHSWAVWSGEPVEHYLDTSPRFMSEYGLQSLPVMRSVRAFAGPDELRIDSPVITAHQKYDGGKGNARILKYIGDNYGAPKDFESFVYLSQVMQAEGIELAATHLRSERPRSMGSLYWQLNDVWPGASWSSIDYYGRRKALAFHARRFYAPLLIAPIRNKGRTHVTLVSDRMTPTAAAWRLRVIDFDGKVVRDERHEAILPPLSSALVADYDDAHLLGGADPRRMVAVFELIVGGSSVSRQFVYFDAAKNLALPDPELRTSLLREDAGYRLLVSAKRFAREVWIDSGDLDVELEVNALTLLPGETVALRLASSEALATIERELHVRDLHDAVRSFDPITGTSQ